MAAAEAVLNTMGECAWNYAGLAHAAKVAGSPEKLVNAIGKSAEAIGHGKGLSKGVAIAGPAGLAVGALGALGIYHAYSSYRKNKEAYETAKSQVVEGINEYDATQSHSSEEEA